MTLRRFKSSASAACRLAALLAVFIFPGAHAAETSGGRWLLVFDNSATMKKCLPGTAAAVKQLFSTSADGQLQTNDSVGIWLVNQRVTQFPAFTWNTNAPAVATNLVAFLQRQHYTNTSQLGHFGAVLDRVVQNSQRLTIILFTDGQSRIGGTPYDDGVNQTFSDIAADRRKSQQPVVVVLRSQLGKFAGCTLAFPPADISFPPFPALPVMPVLTNLAKATNVPAPVKPASHPAVAPAFEMVGDQVVTKGGTNLETHVLPRVPVAVSNAPPAAPVTNHPAPAPAITNTPLPVKVEPPTVPPPANPAPPNPAPTNLIKSVAVAVPPVVPAPAPANPPVPMAVVTQAVTQTVAKLTPPAAVTNAITNVVAAHTETPGGSGKVLIYGGAGILVLVIGGVIAFRSTRRPQTSLISRSMEDEPRRK